MGRESDRKCSHRQPLQERKSILRKMKKLTKVMERHALHILRDFSQGISAYNSGVILFKNAPWVFDLLKDWDNFTIGANPGAHRDAATGSYDLLNIVLRF